MSDVNRLFAEGQRAFLAGRVEEARAKVTTVRRAVGDDPRILHLLGLIEARRGDGPAARAAFEGALARAPGDAAIHDSYAAFLAGARDMDAALNHHDRAVALAPEVHDLRLNRALRRQQAGLLDEALSDLDRLVAVVPNEAKVHSARGSVLRSLNRHRDAAAAFDRALQCDPRRFPALLGRATVAKERGERDAPARFRQALQAKPGAPELIVGLVEAMDVVGEPGGIDILARAVSAQPGWIAGQTLLARLRWDVGEGAADFARDLEKAALAAPRNRELWIAWAGTLADADMSAEAADVAARGQAALGGSDAALALIEAVHASEAGQRERADALFASLPANLPGTALMEMRHRVRHSDYEAADALGAAARAQAPWDVATWAMTGLLWRLTGDPRAQWLLGQPGLVDTRVLALDQRDLVAIAARLRQLHTSRTHPLGQSLRGGTQTRGLLFERDEPEIVRLRAAIEAGVADFWSALPSEDPTHPLLRLRDRRPRIAGSWSVRLTDGGFHVAHFHQRGALSSACYLVVPEARQPMDGWLEIGSAPAGMDAAGEPFRRVEPRPGLMALFPSYFFHGTRRFATDERLTVAFDVVA